MRDQESTYLDGHLALDADEEEASLKDLQSHSITYRIALGPHKGRKAFMLQSLPPLSGDRVGEPMAQAAGFSLHAGVVHSTPAQSLFAETRRDFSHGCVRVSDPVGLAQYVLRESPEWTREKILAAMNGDKPLTVTLKNRIRVFIARHGDGHREGQCFVLRRHLPAR